MRRHFRAAYLVALAQVGERADAEDVCQEAWLRAWEGIHECRDPARFVGWLLTIVRNSAHNRREYLTVRAVEPLDIPSLPASARRTETAPSGESASSRRHRLRANQREVVLLHDLEGWATPRSRADHDVEVMSRRHRSDAEATRRSGGLSHPVHDNEDPSENRVEPPPACAERRSGSGWRASWRVAAPQRPNHAPMRCSRPSRFRSLAGGNRGRGDHNPLRGSGPITRDKPRHPRGRLRLGDQNTAQKSGFLTFWVYAMTDPAARAARKPLCCSYVREGIAAGCGRTVRARPKIH